MFRLSLSLVFVLLLGLAAACGAPAGTTSPTTGAPPVTLIKLSSDVQLIFNASCVVCHQGVSAAGGMNLEAGQAYGSTVSKNSSQSSLLRVKPNDPDNSYLVRKLEGTQVQAGGSGARMPLNANPLPASQIEIIRRWISQGAPNN